MVTVAICLVPMVAILALTLDLGRMINEQQHAQAAADASAMAAADDLFLHYVANQGVDSGTARQAGVYEAQMNGYTAGANMGVTISIPPLTGRFAGNTGYAEAVITRTQPAAFASIFGVASEGVSARAVARGRWKGEDIGILALDPISPASVNSTGGGDFVTNAKFIIDSSNAAAVQTSGGGGLTASEFDVVGGYSGGGFTGPIRTGQTPIPDPLAYLPVPNPSTMPVQSNNKMTISNGTPTLQPGVYKGGISVSGQAGITMAPGIYYMDGGGFSFAGQGSLLAPGVMIYNAPKNSNDIISINGSGKGAVSVAPPTSGVYQGISIFQDRTFTTSMNIGGNGNFSFLGTFYAAKATLKISGSGPTNYIGSQYVSWNLALSGNGNVTVHWDADLVARFRYIGLVE
jgi:hypothetical protein